MKILHEFFSSLVKEPNFAKASIGKCHSNLNKLFLLINPSEAFRRRRVKEPNPHPGTGHLVASFWSLVENFYNERPRTNDQIVVDPFHSSGSTLSLPNVWT